MNYFALTAAVLTWLIIGLGLWFGWQLLRQNGRMLLRLEELEKRFDELEFGDASEPAGSPQNGDHQPSAADDDRANRFSNRSLARSKLKRDGLKAGTVAPNFCLPRLDGRGELSLKDLRGRRVLLVFSDPHCGPCQALGPQLESFQREQSKVLIVMISRGDPKENRAKVKQNGLTFSVLLQQQWEISRLYAMFATPIGYMIDEAGVIANDVAVGVEPIVMLMSGAKSLGRQKLAFLLSGVGRENLMRFFQKGALFRRVNACLQRCGPYCG
jgi:peroxiredoxin